MNKKELEQEVARLREELTTLKQSGKVIDIIYPNVAHLAQWEELKYSIRSLKNLSDVSIRLWIVGDKPDWITDDVGFIPVEFSGKTPRIDILHKHLAVINHPDVGEEYIWMNDDIYLVNKVMYADLCLPVAVDDLQQKAKRLDPQTVWGRDNLRTIRLLKQEGLPTYNYAAHIPHRFEKSKLKFLIDKYNMMEDPIVLTLIYYNYWFQNFTPYRDSLDLTNNQGFCVNRPVPNWSNFDKHLKVKKYLNNSEAGMTEEFQTRLRQLFPDPSSYEKPE